MEKGKVVLGEACVQCHGLASTEMQRKNPEQWRGTVYSMISRGAQVLPDEIEPLVAYLSTRFGPSSPPPQARTPDAPADAGRNDPFVASLPSGEGKDVLLRRCVGCHSLKLVFSSQLSEAQWSKTLDRMVALGCELDGKERKTLTSYLVSVPRE